jgi:hypothetical protein
VIVPTTYDEGMESKFFLRVFYKNDVVKIKQVHPKLNLEEIKKVEEQKKKEEEEFIKEMKSGTEF